MTPPIPARPRVLSVVSEHFRTLPNGDSQHRITRIHATFYDPIDKLDNSKTPGFDRHYTGFFRCFNAQLYYEAHDVLEEVWLPIRGQPQAKIYQGLIQTAGGFDHLPKPKSAVVGDAASTLKPY